MEKKELRKQYLALRKSIPDKAQKSEAICRKLLRLEAFQSAKVIALYRALPDEVDTAGIFQEVLRQGKTPCFPKINGKEMAFITVDADTEFTAAAFGIQEPLSSKAVSPDEIDLIIVPLVAADAAHYRLGFGGGYYDRFLKQCKAPAIGIAFKEQINPEPLPREAHDVPLTKVITA